MFNGALGALRHRFHRTEPIILYRGIFASYHDTAVSERRPTRYPEPYGTSLSSYCSYTAVVASSAVDMSHKHVT